MSDEFYHRFDTPWDESLLPGDGWVTDEGALFTLLQLKGVLPGDHVALEVVTDTEAWNLTSGPRVDLEEVAGEQHHVLHKAYANPELSNRSWRLRAWRRP